MDAQEAKTTREAMGLTREQLAAELGLTTPVIEAWETGRVQVPKRLAVDLRWRGAAAEREKALALSGLAECAVDKAWAQAPVPSDLKESTRHLEAGMAHRLSCPTCQAREAYLKERFGPMPPMSMPAWMTVVGWLDERITRLPRWAQPAAWVGLVFGTFSLIRVIFLLPSLWASPQAWSVMLGGLAASVAIGAIVGLAYGALRHFRERVLNARVG